MSRVLDGKAVAATIRSEVAEQVAALVAAGGRPPGLAAVLVGEDPASKVYVGSKGRACEEVGMVSRTVQLPADLSEDELLATVDALNADDTIDGILVQLPLPDHLSSRTVLDRIDPEKDVDGFHPVSVGRLWLGEPGFLSATPAGVIQLLQREGVQMSGSHAVIVGRSNIVGKPMAALLLRENCTVSICHSRTADLKAMCRQADILIAAIGRPAMIGPEHVKPGAVVVDVGMNRVTDEDEMQRIFPTNEKKQAAFAKRGSVLVGDVDYDRVAPIAEAMTPVPGGVGPLTVAMLLVNTLQAGLRLQGRD